MRAVTVGDVLAFASKKCRLCHGTGHYAEWRTVDPTTKKLEPRVCGCAKRRFDKKHPEVLRREDGTMYWREDEIPRVVLASPPEAYLHTPAATVLDEEGEYPSRVVVP